MTNKEWLDKARQYAPRLEELVGTYHPSTWSEIDPEPLKITARDAEAACGLVRDKVREEEKNLTEAPTVRLKRAIDRGECSEIISLLSSSWFGVPESRSCWSIVGFREAVELLEDPPEDEYENGEEEVG